MFSQFVGRDSQNLSLYFTSWLLMSRSEPLIQLDIKEEDAVCVPNCNEMETSTV